MLGVLFLLLPDVLHGSEENHLSKGHQLSEVEGRVSVLLINMVVITSIVVRFTLRAASKKKGLKKVVAKVISMRRSDGKKVVIISDMIFLFILIVILIPSPLPALLKSRSN